METTLVSEADVMVAESALVDTISVDEGDSRMLRSLCDGMAHL